MNRGLSVFEYHRGSLVADHLGSAGIFFSAPTLAFCSQFIQKYGNCCRGRHYSRQFQEILHMM